MIYGLLLAFTLASPFFLWVYYLAVMNLKRAKGEGGLKGLTLYLGGLALAIGYLLDAYVNFLVLSFVLLEFPRELTVTSRLKRHYKRDGTWGKKVALWFVPLLEPYDNGHITG